MTNWLIRALGGVPISELDVLNASLEGWRSRAIAAETSVALFKEIMTRDRERAEREDRPAATPPNPTPPNMKPVGHTLSSWPRIKRQLERDHQVKQDAQVPREEIERTIREG